MKKHFLILVAILGLITAKAQVSNTHLSFGSSGVAHPQYVSPDEVISYSFWLVNTGNIPLEGEVEILSNFNNSVNVRCLGHFADTDSVLSPNDSIYILAWDQVSYLNYIGGDNIVVIWPNAISPFPITTDEYTGTINLDTGTSSISETGITEINVFPNPITEKSVVELSSGVSTFRIYDVLGKVVRFEENIKTDFIAINKNELQNGVYFIEVNIEGKVITEKIIIK